MMILVPTFLTLLWCHTCLNVMGALLWSDLLAPCAPPPPASELVSGTTASSRAKRHISGTRLVAGHLNNGHTPQPQPQQQPHLAASVSAPLQRAPGPHHPHRAPVPDANLDAFRTMILEESHGPGPRLGEVVSYYVAEERGPGSTPASDPGASVLLLHQQPAPFATDVHLVSGSTPEGTAAPPVTPKPLLILVPSGPGPGQQAPPWSAAVSPRPPPPWTLADTPRTPPWTPSVSPPWVPPARPTASPSYPPPVSPRPPPLWAPGPSTSASHRQPQWTLPSAPAAPVDLLPSGPGRGAGGPAEFNSVLAAAPAPPAASAPAPARPESIQTLYSWRSNISALLDNILYRPPVVPSATTASTAPAPAPAAASSDVSGAQASAEQPSSLSSRTCVSAADGSAGVCYSAAGCRRRGGRAEDVCQASGPGPWSAAESAVAVCCVFRYSCGDVTTETSATFQSPDYPSKSAGSLACDFDVVVQKDACAVRVEFVSALVARRLGGACDVDQLLVLNSADGPTAPLCGPLSGYATTVAVTPGQQKPLKVAALLQSDGPYYWSVQLTQLSCQRLPQLQAPTSCGRQFPPDGSAGGAPGGVPQGPYSYQQQQGLATPAPMAPLRRLGDLYGTRQPGGVWWDFPEASSTFHQRALRRQLQQLRQLGSGMHLPQLQERIVGGQDASRGEFPWQAALLLDHLFFCGGTLINHEFVLTAAHCLMTRDTPVAGLRVLLGALDLTAAREPGGEERAVRRVLFHSHFQPFLLDHDIALLQLQRPVPLSSVIEPACLPGLQGMTGGPAPGLTAWVTGWGITSFPAGDPSAVLQRLAVETLPVEVCARQLEEPLGAGMVCAAPASVQGTCFGDSGGPLTLEQAGRGYVVGVVSFGVTGCAALPHFPDVYTRVSQYLQWIHVNALP
ncbi:Transmembrane protease serine 13 [Frankliniella fusca]|uniref:limulus clotting factor C n=1 Tax=Frankliniella fusca TaxID=407009 RepID=A0AAE1LGJ0_9NEOP|nr:Transmembrane protease serine 13 [Frankliniella fusca]